MRLVQSVMVMAAAMSVCAAAQSAKDVAAQDKLVKLNQIQVIGTHNSYNLGFAPSEAALLKSKSPEAYASLEYSHKSLQSQLDGGVRQLEIDVFADPTPGVFAHPVITSDIQKAGLPADPEWDPTHEMDKPGLKVIHMQDVNQRSSCALFTTCMKQVREWTKLHPQAVPLFLLIETKSGKSYMPGGVAGRDWTTADFDALDAEIRSVFHDDEIVLPDAVRGKHKTLRDGVLAGNWPTLAASRGKVIFLLDQRKASPVYTAGHPNLEGRVLFTHAVPADQDAAFIEMNEATKSEIDAVIKQGFIVRARADESTKAARNNDTTRRDELLASGATMISTDYPLSEPSGWSGYSVGFPGGFPVRCNPVSAPKGCKDALLEPDAKSGGAMSAVHHP